MAIVVSVRVDYQNQTYYQGNNKMKQIGTENIQLACNLCQMRVNVQSVSSAGKLIVGAKHGKMYVLLHVCVCDFILARVDGAD